MKYNKLDFKKKNTPFSYDYFKLISDFFKWDFNFKNIYVVGTNGKGSNCKYIHDELVANGYNVGTFTSPHILDVNERIIINKKPIETTKLDELHNKLKRYFSSIEFGWFDTIFFIAIMYFHENNLDVVIWEAGIGAKKDIVNFIDHDYSIITSVGIDHQELLGKSITEIATDKSYAIKSNRISYITDDIDENCLQIFLSRANNINSKLHIVNTNKETYKSINKSIAKTFLENEFNIKEFKSNFESPRARMEKININGINCYLDVSHNIQGFKKTFEYIQKQNILINEIVLSISKDKDAKEIFNFLKNKNTNIYCYENKGLKPLEIKDYDKSFIVIRDLKSYIKKINKPTLFIGSFYFISDILKLM